MAAFAASGSPTPAKVVQGYLREGSTLVEIGAPVLGSALSSQFKVVSAFRDAPLVNAPAPPPGAPAEVAQRPQWFDTQHATPTAEVDGLLLGGALAPTAASAGALRHLAPDGALSHFTRGVVAVCGADQPSEAYLCHQLRALLARTHECREFAHCAFAAFVPLAWLEASAPAAAPCVHPLPRAPPFGACGRVHEGFMPQGNDELTAEMSLQEAVEYCHASRECRGFTYRASEALPAGKLKIWFKTTRRVKVKPGCGWFAYIAGFPADDAREAAEAAASASALAKKGSLSSLLHGHGFGGGQGGPPSKRQHAEHPAAPGRPARGKYLVFTSAGDSSFLDKWFRPPAGAAAVERTWDCCIVYYGSQKRRWAEYADMYIENKGGKFENLLHVYKTHANFIHKYDAVMVLDDDVGIDAAGINRCFELREQFDLWLLQPAFDPAGKISHTVTRLQVGPSLRYTNFIEMTCPLFEKQALDRFMNVFDPSLKGWGADWWFLQVHNCTPAQLDGKVAVADAVPCINPHDAAKPGQMREITKLQGRDDRVRVWEGLKKKHQLMEWPKVQFSAVWII